MLSFLALLLCVFDMHIPREAQVAIMANALQLSYVLMNDDEEGTYKEFLGKQLLGQNFVVPGDTVLYEEDYATVMAVNRLHDTVTLGWSNGTPFDDGWGDYRWNVSLDAISRLRFRDVAGYFKLGEGNYFDPQELLRKFRAGETGASGAAASGGDASAAASGGAARSQSELELLGQLSDARRERAAAEVELVDVNETLRQRTMELIAQRKQLIEKLNDLKRKRDDDAAGAALDRTVLPAEVQRLHLLVTRDQEHRRRRSIWREA